jgi:hypothetical protein
MKLPDSENLLHCDLVIRSERDRQHDRRREKRNEMIVIICGLLLMTVTGVWYWLKVTGRF